MYTSLYALHGDIDSLFEYMRILATQELNPTIIPPDVLKTILHRIEDDIKSNARLKLYEDPNTNIWSYYGTIKLTPIVLQDYLMLILTVPLIDQTLHMNLFKAHNLPMLHPTLQMHVQYELEGPYLATLMDSMFITLPTAMDVRLCLMPHMFSTIDGRLTPTEPAYEDMRTETPLDVTPEESLEGLSAAVGGIEDERANQQPSDHVEGMVTSVAPPVSRETKPKVIGQEELPGRTEITRETSREDAIAATRCFFTTVTERRSATDVPVTTTVSVTQTDTPPVTSLPIETERREPETSPMRTFLPSGLPPRPTATATLRPGTQEQRISEGQIEEES